MIKNKPHLVSRETAERAVLDAWKANKITIVQYDDLMSLASAVGSDGDLSALLQLLEIWSK